MRCGWRWGTLGKGEGTTTTEAQRTQRNAEGHNREKKKNLTQRRGEREGAQRENEFVAFYLSGHALQELRRRGIPRDLLESVVTAPEQVTPERGTMVCYQSRVVMEGRPYLLRAIVDVTKQPMVVVTVYRTSKIAKYWRST